MKNIAAFGLFHTQQNVEEAVEALKLGGFRNTDISVLVPENMGSKDLGHEKHTKAPEGATTGAASGAILGVPWGGLQVLALWPFPVSAFF